MLIIYCLDSNQDFEIAAEFHDLTERKCNFRRCSRLENQLHIYQDEVP